MTKGLSGPRDFRAALPAVTDVHVHLEPYRTLKPHVLEMLWREITDRDLASRLMDDPRAKPVSRPHPAKPTDAWQTFILERVE